MKDPSLTMSHKKNSLLMATVALLLMIVPTLVSFQQTPSSLNNPEQFRVLWWNVENLFDTYHDSLKHDEEFMPEGKRHWTYGRYQKKLSQIARVICTAGGWKAPVLVGLGEIENEHVIKDLVYHSPLKALGYSYVLTNCQDLRGIDIALLYQRDEFKLLSTQTFPISKPSEAYRPTRDLFHVCGALLTGDTLDVILAHFPSRSGGRKETEPYRLQAARQLYDLADSLHQTRTTSHILIMGDLNDYPNNASIQDILLSHSHTATDTSNTEAPIQLRHMLQQPGVTPDETNSTYKFKGQWGLLDHIFVNTNLLDTCQTFHTTDTTAKVLSLPYLLSDDPTYGGRCPFRTYLGMRYQGGYSDHLPVYIDFRQHLPEGF